MQMLDVSILSSARWREVEVCSLLYFARSAMVQCCPEADVLCCRAQLVAHGALSGPTSSTSAAAIELGLMLDSKKTSRLSPIQRLALGAQEVSDLWPWRDWRIGTSSILEEEDGNGDESSKYNSQLADPRELLQDDAGVQRSCCL
jgi:hypothetical protein